VLTIGLNHAVSLLAEPKARGRASNRPAEREVGVHPALNEKITAAVGRYGPYVRLGKTYANLPSELKPETVTLEEAVSIIDARIEKSSGKPPKPAKPKKPAKGEAKATKDDPGMAEARAKFLTEPKPKAAKTETKQADKPAMKPPAKTAPAPPAKATPAPPTKKKARG